MISIAPTARSNLVDHCRAELPNEACGLLIGNAEDQRIDRFVPLTNVAASPTRFVFDGAEQLAAERHAEDAGQTIVGVAHSHPEGDNAPSAVDVGDAKRFDPFGVWWHLVVSPRSGSVRAFRIGPETVVELDLA